MRHNRHLSPLNEEGKVRNTYNQEEERNNVGDPVVTTFVRYG